MNNPAKYDNTIVRAVLTTGDVFMGPCMYYNADYGLVVFDHQEDSLKIGDTFVFVHFIKEIEVLRNEVCIPVREWIEAKEEIAAWFHERWHHPLDAYMESIRDCIRKEDGVPQWYVVVRGHRIIAGCGVIENDFHERKDLSPNVCAVYVDEEYRNQGVAGFMLDFVCKDMADLGYRTLYLLTDHKGFYEKYNWQFDCMVRSDDGELSRMYIHQE